MNKIRCIIVDDEPLAANVIKTHLEKVDKLELVSVCSNAVETFNILSSTQIDLIFLDIKMPQISGMELLKSLTYSPKIIITTAYRDYAVESYEFNVVDYLLKPISFERFLKAIGKLTLQQQTEIPLISAENKQEYIFVKSNKKQIKISLDKILYIEGLKEYLQIVTTTEKIVSYLSLSYMTEKLPSERFIRVHRSYIISLEKIKSFSATEITLPGKTIPIGSHYKQSVVKLLNNSL